VQGAGGLLLGLLAGHDAGAQALPAFSKGPGGDQLALGLEQGGQVVEALGGVGVVGAQHPLPDGRGTLEERPGGGQPDDSLPDAAQREKLAGVRRYAPFQLGKNGAFPAYALSNLNGNLARQCQRLAQLIAEARP